MDVIFQGHVAIDGSTKILCSSNSLIIDTIIINNLDSDYIFSLSRFMTGPGIHEIPIYNLQLSQGDSIRDTDTYILEKNNYLQLTTDVVGTTFYIKGTQQ